MGVSTILYYITILLAIKQVTDCVCVCVFFPFILDIKLVGRTSRGHTGGRSHRISHPPSFCGACLHFFREMNSGIPYLLSEKIIRLPGSNSRPNVSEGYEVTSELPERLARLTF